MDILPVRVFRVVSESAENGPIKTLKEKWIVNVAYSTGNLGFVSNRRKPQNMVQSNLAKGSPRRAIIDTFRCDND